MRTRPIALGLVLLVGGGPVDAQTIAAGTKLRVWTAQPDLSKQQGTVVARQGDTLLIQRAHGSYYKLGTSVLDTVRVPWSGVRRLDVWQGRSHVRGALKGFLFGIGTGLVAGGAVAWGYRAGSEGMSVLAIPVFGTIGAVSGTLLGGIIGSARWRRVHP